MATTDKNANVTVTTVNGDNALNPTDYTDTVTRTSHTEETHKGHKVTVNRTVDTDETLSGSFDDRVMALVNGAIAEREARENMRANHRNLNRMLTLFGALVIGLVVTFVLQHKGIPGLVTLPVWTMALAPYTFVITIALDSGLALYGYIRHY